MNDRMPSGQVPRRADADERLAEARKIAVLEAALDAIVMMDHTGVVTEFNPSAERMFGYARAEAVGEPLAELIIPPSLRDRHRDGLRRYLETGQANILGKRLELSALRKDGSEIPVELAVVRIPASEPPMFVGFLRDLTERERLTRDRMQAQMALRDAEEQLRQSQKMEAVGNLAGGIAHDFNNLLSVILGFTSLARDEIGDNESLAEKLDQIALAGRRAAELTRQLLAFGRRQVLQPEILDLNNAIRSTHIMFTRILGEDIELTFCPGEALGKVFVDPGQFEQILMNLAVNARDAMPTGGKLTIETANVELDSNYAAEHVGVEPGPHVILSVSDTGIGMDPATQARIFEPFFTTKDVGKGSGLGLSMVFGIVKQSAGSIWVYSEPGRGTSFKIYFPRVEGTDAERAKAGVAGEGGSETILLVEDHDQLRRMARAILETGGYEVLVAPDAEEALAILAQQGDRVGLILTDVVMPRMSGPQLVERIRILKPTLKVLFMSGYSDDAVVRHGMLEGAAAFLQKPVTPDMLLAKVREVLGS
jgi:two-component system cell cycle sensor histidine kinase/response regulator CckA